MGAPLLLAQASSLLFSISAVCNIVFLLVSPWSLRKLYGSPVRVRVSWQSRAKIVNILFHEASTVRKILIP